MPYIIEARVNGKERIYKINDTEGRKLQEQFLHGSMPNRLLLHGEALSADAVQMIAKLEVWMENDRKALSTRSLVRCSGCLAVHLVDASCNCRPLETSEEPEYLKDTPKLTQEELREGFIRAIKEALRVNPKLMKSGFADGLIHRYMIAPEELSLASYDH